MQVNTVAQVRYRSKSQMILSNVCRLIFPVAVDAYLQPQHPVFDCRGSAELFLRQHHVLAGS